MHDDADMERAHLNIGEWFAASCAKLTSRLFAILDETGTFLRSARENLMSIGHRARMGHLRLQEGVRQSERQLTRLLVDSLDPMIVTDDSHRLLAANSAALALFGVSRSNISNFTIDAFLSPRQIHCFERTGPPFVKGNLRLGECEIRRMDGKLRSVGYTFQANFILGRHLSKFQVEDIPARRKLDP